MSKVSRIFIYLTDGRTYSEDLDSLSVKSTVTGIYNNGYVIKKANSSEWVGPHLIDKITLQKDDATDGGSVKVTVKAKTGDCYSFLSSSQGLSAAIQDVWQNGYLADGNWLSPTDIDTVFWTSLDDVSDNLSSQDALRELALQADVEHVDRTIYVNAETGSDLFDGSTAGFAFKTITAALLSIKRTVNCVISVQIATGSYVESKLMTTLTRFSGIGSVKLYGQPVHVPIVLGAVTPAFSMIRKVTSINGAAPAMEINQYKYRAWLVATAAQSSTYSFAVLENTANTLKYVSAPTVAPAFLRTLSTYVTVTDEGDIGNYQYDCSVGMYFLDFTFKQDTSTALTGRDFYFICSRMTFSDTAALSFRGDSSIGGQMYCCITNCKKVSITPLMTSLANIPGTVLTEEFAYSPTDDLSALIRVTVSGVSRFSFFNTAVISPAITKKVKAAFYANHVGVSDATTATGPYVANVVNMFILVEDSDINGIVHPTAASPSVGLLFAKNVDYILDGYSTSYVKNPKRRALLNPAYFRDPDTGLALPLSTTNWLNRTTLSYQWDDQLQQCIGVMGLDDVPVDRPSTLTIAKGTSSVTFLGNSAYDAMARVDYQYTRNGAIAAGSLLVVPTAGAPTVYASQTTPDALGVAIMASYDLTVPTQINLTVSVDATSTYPVSFRRTITRTKL